MIRLQTDAPLYSDVDGWPITDRVWGAYFRPDFYFGGFREERLSIG